ncbi:hypothetical protein AM588_10011714 [Phytophthora nicotianae]|uniref:Uncharacterized protein n=1 Tax=Phytophthora nicotianae TaxID=4792 RepID=A0A0W8DM38_PHYNI|nr:hypothetical protein AM588_10011714 [Phytophthora nicotianae]
MQDSQSSTHSKSALRSPLTSSLDEQGSTPSASSSYFIEGPWRAKKKYQANQVIVMVRQKKRENDAAVKLQAAWKRRKARIEVNLMRLAKDLYQQKLVDAVLMVQTNWRGRHGRLQARSLKQTAMEKISQLVKIQHHAVTFVQAHYRGWKGREKYREAQLNKKKRWKEITRPENGEKFYYTNENCVERPNEFATPRISAAEAAGDGGDEGLAEYYDPVTGKSYFFNARTTECRQASAT